MAANAKRYSRLTQDVHASLIDDALRAHITPTLSAAVKSTCPLDNDDDIAALRHSLDGAGGPHNPARHTPAVPTADPAGHAPRTPDAGARAPDAAATATGSDDESGSDDEQPVAAGSPIGPSELAPRMAVAVPFRTRRHGETHFAGRIVRVMANTARVRFPDVDGTSTCYDVGFHRLFEVARPSQA